MQDEEELKNDLDQLKFQGDYDSYKNEEFQHEVLNTNANQEEEIYDRFETDNNNCFNHENQQDSLQQQFEEQHIQINQSKPKTPPPEINEDVNVVQQIKSYVQSLFELARQQYELQYYERMGSIQEVNQQEQNNDVTVLNQEDYNIIQQTESTVQEVIQSEIIQFDRKQSKKEMPKLDEYIEKQNVQQDFLIQNQQETFIPPSPPINFQIKIPSHQDPLENQEVIQDPMALQQDQEINVREFDHQLTNIQEENNITQQLTQGKKKKKGKKSKKKKGNRINMTMEESLYQLDIEGGTESSNKEDLLKVKLDSKKAEPQAKIIGEENQNDSSIPLQIIQPIEIQKNQGMRKSTQNPDLQKINTEILQQDQKLESPKSQRDSKINKILRQEYRKPPIRPNSQLKSREHQIKSNKNNLNIKEEQDQEAEEQQVEGKTPTQIQKKEIIKGTLKSKEFKEDMEETKVNQQDIYVPPNQKFAKKKKQLTNIDDESNMITLAKQTPIPQKDQISRNQLFSSEEKKKDRTIQQIQKHKIQDGMPPFNQSVGNYNFYSLRNHQNIGTTPGTSDHDISLPGIRQAQKNQVQSQLISHQGQQVLKKESTEKIKQQIQTFKPHEEIQYSKTENNLLSKFFQQKINNELQHQQSNLMRSNSLHNDDILQKQLDNLERDIQSLNINPVGGNNISDNNDTEFQNEQYQNENYYTGPLTRSTTQHIKENLASTTKSPPTKKAYSATQSLTNVEQINNQLHNRQSPRLSSEQQNNSQRFNQDANVVQPLIEQCRIHPSETIKYFCRDQNCLKPLCPDCIIDHSKHDFIAANELAALEIKQVVKQAERKCKKQIKLQKELRTLTEQRLSELNRQRREEFHKIHCYFIELHKDLDEREGQLNAQYNEDIKDIENQLMKDIQQLQSNYQENLKFFKHIKGLEEQYFISNEIGIVGTAEQVYKLNHTISSRDLASTNYEYFVKTEEGQKEVPTPTFIINLTNEKSKISSIGRFISPYDDNFEEIKPIQEQVMYQEIYEPLNISKNKGLYIIPEERKSQQESKYTSDIDPQHNSHSRKIKDQVQVKDASSQTQNIPNVPEITIKQDQQNRESLSSQKIETQEISTYVNPANLHWFKWDSLEIYRFNIEEQDWIKRNELKVSTKFLFFSSIVHLPNDQGCFIMGGSDNDDNYSKRVQYFCKYNVFIEKPHMINKRAFFPSIFSKLDNSIYAIGGSDSNSSDLNQCEKFSLAENVWRPLSPMNLSRNGTGAVIFDNYRLLFVFGGNNHKHGSLSKIEKYEVDFDKWSIIDIHLKKGIHDLQAFNVGRERVLIFGGHTNTEPSKEVQLIDLSFECFKSRNGRMLLKEGGKSYLTPSFDQNTGKVKLLFGYCDDKPRIEEIDINDITLFSNNQQPSRRDSNSRFSQAKKSLSLGRQNKNQEEL